MRRRARPPRGTNNSGNKGEGSGDAGGAGRLGGLLGHIDPFLDPADRLAARIASNQHGVIRVGQLMRAGLSRTQVKLRLRAGRLHRLHRGVYAVGHTNLSTEGRLIAAVFACGPKAALSHDSAAYLWSFLPRCPPLHHVTIPHAHGKTRRKGIVLHRSRTLTPSDVTRRKNIPLTTPARTKLDMGWTTERTRSDLERKFVSLLRAHALPPPAVNARLGPYEVDFLWRAERLVVELDGYAYHSSRASFESDRRRDRELQARGFVVLRFTYGEVVDRPGMVVATLKRHLRRVA
jgi:very-short-patch-repair endonuclease